MLGPLHPRLLALSSRAKSTLSFPSSSSPSSTILPEDAPPFSLPQCPLRVSGQPFPPPLSSPVAGDEREIDAFFRTLPGPPSYPFVGAFPYFNRAGGAMDFDGVLWAYYRDFGNRSRFEVMGNRMLLLHHPSDFRPIFQAEGKYPASPAGGFVPLLHHVRERGMESLTLGTSEGEAWRGIRLPLQRHLLPPHRARAYHPLMAEVAKEGGRRVAEEGGDLGPLLPKYSFEAIAAALFGKRLHNVTTPHPADAKFLECTLDMFGAGNKLQYGIPFYKYLETTTWRRFKRSYDYILSRGAVHIREIMEEYKRNPESAQKSYMGQLLAHEDLPFEVLTINVSGMLMAGVDTTSNTIAWLIYHLAKFPEAQEKLHAELKEVLRGGEYSDDVLPLLPYLKMAVKESERLNPNGPGLIRCLERPATLPDGVVVPAGTKVLLTNLASRDGRFFRGADRFIPERWSEEEVARRAQQGEQVHDHPLLQLPFSFGPRMCVGMRVASFAINSLISRVVQDYHVALEEGQPPVRRKSLLLYTLDPFPRFRFTPRSK